MIIKIGSAVLQIFSFKRQILDKFLRKKKRKDNFFSVGVQGGEQLNLLHHKY